MRANEYVVCHVHPKRDVLELVGVGESSYVRWKLKWRLEAAVHVGCLKGQWLLQPLADSYNRAR